MTNTMLILKDKLSFKTFFFLKYYNICISQVPNDHKFTFFKYLKCISGKVQ